MLRSVAVSAKCIAIANSGFSGGAVRSTTGCFGEVVKGKVVMDHHRPWTLPVSPWNCA